MIAIILASATIWSVNSLLLDLPQASRGFKFHFFEHKNRVTCCVNVQFLGVLSSAYRLDTFYHITSSSGYYLRYVRSGEPGEHLASGREHAPLCPLFLVLAENYLPKNLPLHIKLHHR